MSTQKTYVCERCGKSFDRPSEKGGHMVRHKQRIHPIEKLLEIRDLAARKGRVPTQAEMDDEGDVSSHTIIDEFGSWNEGVRAAGLQPKHRKSIPDTDVLEAIQSLAETLGHPPSMTTMEERGTVSVDVACDRFGSWTNAVRAAGYEPVSEMIVPPNRISESEVVSAIQELAAEKGRAPCASEMNEEGSVPAQTVRSRYGSFEDAVRAAGLEPFDPKAAAKKSEDEVVSAIRDLARELDAVPTVDEMEAHGEHSASLVEARFGSWNAGLRAAGFEPNLRRDIPTDELLSAIDRLESELGRVPRWIDNRRHGEFSVQTYHDRFGDWDSALEAAGYEPPGHPSGEDHHWWKDPEDRSSGFGYYGADWSDQRRRARERDDQVCQMPGCEMTDERHRERHGYSLHVHHITPLRSFVDDDGTIDYDEANALDNLVTLCVAHHARVEGEAPGELIFGRDAPDPSG